MLKHFISKIRDGARSLPFAVVAAIVALSPLPVFAEDEIQFGGRSAPKGAEQSSMFPPGRKPILPVDEPGGSESMNKGFVLQPVFVPTLMCCDTVTVPGAWLPMCPMNVNLPVGSVCTCWGALGAAGVGLVCIR